MSCRLCLPAWILTALSTARGRCTAFEAVADGFDLSEDEIGHALVFCNDFSRRARLPKAFIANGRLKLDQWTVFPEATDDEYISQYIELVLTMCWSFFVNAKQKLNN